MELFGMFFHEQIQKNIRKGFILTLRGISVLSLVSLATLPVLQYRSTVLQIYQAVNWTLFRIWTMSVMVTLNALSGS